MGSGGDQSGQNRSYRKDLSNIRCFTFGEMGHYASFHDKQALPLVVARVGPVYTGGALSANMASVLKDYYCPETEDNTFSAPAIIKKGSQRTGRKPKSEVNIPRLQQAIDHESILDDDKEFTPVEDMDELEGIPVPTKIQYVCP